MIEVSGLKKSYEEFALNQISFRVKSGRITGFIGNNGAGKTTTIKCILGLVHYESGKILIDGKTLQKNEREYKEKIGVIFDSGYFYNNLSIKAMKEIVAASYRYWDENLFQNYLKKYDLNEKQTIKTLSRGMKMKFALTLALSHNADVLILDEPTEGLDAQTRNLFCEEMLKQRALGKTILFSTHITSDLDRIGDDIILINKGNILLQETKEKFLKAANLEDPSIEDIMLKMSKGEM